MRNSVVILALCASVSLAVTNFPPFVVLGPVLPVSAAIEWPLVLSPVVSEVSFRVVPDISGDTPDPLLAPVAIYPQGVLGRLAQAIQVAAKTGKTNEYQRLREQYWRLLSLSLGRETNTALRAK